MLDGLKKEPGPWNCNARPAFSGRNTPTLSLYRSMHGMEPTLRTQTSARIRRSDTPKQESTFTTSQKRDTQRAQFVRGDSYWTFVPKVDVGPFEGAATKPKGSAALGERKSTTLRRPTARPKGCQKRSRSKNSLVPNVDLHK